jgi:hypothetical protein
MLIFFNFTELKTLYRLKIVNIYRFLVKILFYVNKIVLIFFVKSQ